MRLFNEPKVYLIGRQEVITEELERFLEDEGCAGFKSDAPSAGEMLVEIAGRIDYNSYKRPRPGGNKAYINNIKEHQHGSVTEMGIWQFIFTNISRSLTHELIRHRHFSPSQRSQRYCDESQVGTIIPDLIKDDPDLVEDYDNTVDLLKSKYILYFNKMYDNLTKGKNDLTPEERTHFRKLARGAARYILPEGTETKIFISTNTRALRNFLELRGSRFAEGEIRKLAFKVLEVIQEEAPNLFGDYEIIETNGTKEITTKYRKI